MLPQSFWMGQNVPDFPYMSFFRHVLAINFETFHLANSYLRLKDMGVRTALLLPVGPYIAFHLRIERGL